MVAAMKVELCELAFRYTHLRPGGGEARRRLQASLAEEGQRVPVLVVRDGDALVLIDGYARCEALRGLGRDEVAAVVLDGDEVDALVLSHQLVRGRRKTALEQAWLVAELLERHGLTQVEVARRLGKSSSWVSRHRAMTTVLPEAVRAAVKRGQVSVQVASRHLVPLARANADACGQLVEHLGDHRLTVREAKVLHDAWRRSDHEQRERLVAAPQLYLKVHAHAQGHRAAPEVARALELAAHVVEGLDRLHAVIERGGMTASEAGIPQLHRRMNELRARAEAAWAACPTSDEKGGHRARRRDESRGLEAS